MEELSDLLASAMDRRDDQVRGWLVAELHDPLAQIGVHDPDALRLEMGVEATLLREHRLALDDPLHVSRLQEPGHDLAQRRRVVGPVDHGPRAAGVALEGL